jgi:hypothetical protein
MLNFDICFRDFASLTASHASIAAESDVNTKLKDSVSQIALEYLTDNFSGINASWLRNRLLFITQNAIDLSRTINNAGCRAAILTAALQQIQIQTEQFSYVTGAMVTFAVLNP